MGCSIKVIVKFGLIAEIITAIVGSIGEFSLRYQTYSMAMDELFGSYYDRNYPDSSSSKIHHSHQHHHHTEWPSNHQHYDHLTGESFPLSQLNAMATLHNNEYNNNSYKEKNNQLVNENVLSKFINHLSLWFLPNRSDIFENQNQPVYQKYDSFHIDPRPLLVLSILILFNIIFIIAVFMEYLPLIGSMATIWILYLIMLFVIIRVMNDSKAKMISEQEISHVHKIEWSTLLSSPFIILVVIIILLFTFILIALITEERRQIAARIRTRSACIPLVKSRDMDLDDI